MSAVKVKASKVEGTAFPWWFIVVPHQYIRFSKKEDFTHGIAQCIIGPFFSRETAESHRKSRIYEYGKDSIVWCSSGFYSKDYRDIYEEENDLPLQNIKMRNEG